MIDILRNNLVTIRKPHRCHGCNRRYDKGDRMFSWTCAEDGNICNGYSCETCDKIMKLSYKDFEDGFPESFVSEWLIDSNIETPERLLEMLNNQKK